MEHRFDNILADVIHIVKNDYAGFEEKRDRHDSRYFVTAAGTAWKKGTLDELRFLQIMSQYLASLEDPCIGFYMADHDGYMNTDVGFKVRRYGDDLYVTEVTKDRRLQAGDRIFAINRNSPGMHSKKFIKPILRGNLPEREQWGCILKMADHFAVEHKDGTLEDLPVLRFPAGGTAARPEFSMPREGVCCLRINTVDDALRALIKENSARLAACSGLIIDIRNAGGGTGGQIIPLLPYVTDEPANAWDLIDAEPVLNLYTKANCDRKIAELSALKKQLDDSGERGYDRMINRDIIDFRRKSGAGWTLEEGYGRDEQPQQVCPAENIEHVVLITDTWCRDSAEEFADVCRRSSKVTVIGRPTRGTIDYTNNVTVVFDGMYVLTYPMGKRQHVAQKIRYNETGLPVDIYVPWTPEECAEDILMKKALEVL